MKELLKLANDDYQKRGGSYPKSLIPDTVRVEVDNDSATIIFDFKNTSDSEAIEWYEKSKEFKTINKFKKDFDIAISTSQDGDFEDDWQQLTVLLTQKDTPKVAPQSHQNEKVPSSTKSTKKSKPDDTGYTYSYILSTLEQRKAIDLIKHKTVMEKIIKQFFGDRLVSVNIEKNSYSLTLKNTYEVSDKRRLGRLISDGLPELKKHVHKIIYNGNKDTSGQLFRLKKDSATGSDDETV